MDFCELPIRSRSKYSPTGLRRCFRAKEHDGTCGEFPFLAALQSTVPRVAQKIVRDSTMTTGASWKSADAGPNRTLRWVMLLSDEELLQIGINMAGFQPQVVAKLREKSADYVSCIAVAMKLTSLAYSMADAPVAPDELLRYLKEIGSPVVPGSTICQVCREPLNFRLFHDARRGKAEIETSHSSPRLHTPDNVGFAHRACNIAQGNKTLDEFYAWIASILERVAQTSAS